MYFKTVKLKPNKKNKVYSYLRLVKSVRINVNWGDASLLTWLGGLGFGMSLGKLVEFERPL